ncbi:MAG: hypothetical protein RLZZ344_964 [Pseudomonadota bacterium]|jgi:hypothetical protein
MLTGTEAIAQVGGKILPIYLEGRLIPVPEATSRELALNPNQVVRAVVEMRGESLVLMINGKALEMAPQAKYKPGDALWLRLVDTPQGGLALKQVPPPAGTPAGGVPTPAAAAAAAGVQPAVSPTVSSLFAQPANLSGLTALLSNAGGLAALTSSLQAVGGLGPLGILLQGRAAMARLTPEAVKNAMRASGLFTESRLARGEQVAGDMKAALRDALVRMGQSPRMVDGLRQATQSAVREIESSQADSLAAASQRELSFGFVIPFKDADPVLVQFFRPRKTQEQPDPPFTINLHTQSQDLGEVWMKTVVGSNRSLDLVMWADRADTADRAQKAKAELVEELEGAGMSVHTLLVVHGRRPPDPSPVIGESPGVVFDRQA